jgi:GNAT acetyltransferase
MQRSIVLQRGTEHQVEIDTALLLPVVFPSPTDFVQHGTGYCARTGKWLVCETTSVARYDNTMEMQINTKQSLDSKSHFSLPQKCSM